MLNDGRVRATAPDRSAERAAACGSEPSHGPSGPLMAQISDLLQLAGYYSLAVLAVVLVAYVLIVHATPWVSALVTAAVIVSRHALLHVGLLHGGDAVRTVDVAAGVAAACLGLAVLRRGHATTADGLAVLTAVLGLPLAAFAVIELTSEQQPQDAAAPSCRGAAVIGSRFLATTSKLGANARSGPSTTFPQTRRFGSQCTLGFDGFCVGEAVPDSATKLPDVRWLRLHGTNDYVASGHLTAQSGDDRLRHAPEGRCGRLGGFRFPGRVGMAVSPGSKPDRVSLTVHGSGAPLVGFARLLPGLAKDSAVRVTQIGITPKLNSVMGGTHAEYILVGDVTAEHQSRVVVAAVPCLAPVVPRFGGGYYAAFTVSPAKKARGPLAPDALSRDDLRRLETAACRVAPEADVPQVTKAANAP